MNNKAKELAASVDAFNQEIIDIVKACTAQQWQLECSAEQWPVGVTARHIAASHFEVSALVRMIVAGEPLPELTGDQIVAMANEHARAHHDCTAEEVLELLATNGASLSAFIGSLTDEQLDRSGYLALTGGKVTAAQLVEFVVLGSAGEHRDSIRAALGQL